jgi:anti-sigma B factor antagonist
VTILRCTGALVDGAATTRLHDAVSAGLPVERTFVLNLAAVEYVDSFGLGVLTRLIATIRSAGGALTLSAVPPNVARVLGVTRLADVIEAHATDEEAIAAIAHASGAAPGSADLSTDILCVESPPEVLAFVQQVLKGAGLRVITAANVADASTLFRARRPRVLVIGAALRAAFEAKTAGYRLPAIIELPPGFRTEEPTAAASWLLDQVRAHAPSA